MAVCYALISGMFGTVSLVVSGLSGHTLSAAMLSYLLAGFCGVMLVALWRANHDIRLARKTR